MKQEKIADAGATRREFIKKSALATAVVATSSIFKTPVYGQNQAPSPGSVVGANNRLQVAYIGTGNQGMLHVNLQKQNAVANNIVQVTFPRTASRTPKAPSATPAFFTRITRSCWSERTLTPSPSPPTITGTARRRSPPSTPASMCMWKSR
jgi:hypothetical protein